MRSEKINPPKSLYIHVPFCQHLCHYCDFPKMLYFPHFVEGYLNTLERQLRDDVLAPCETVFLGGGTPTALTVSEFERLLKITEPYINKVGAYEWTVEINPETMNHEKMSLLAKFGVNRLSLGVQSFQPHLLKALGRHHTKDHVEATIWLARSYQISNISIDLMYGLPGQTLDDLQHDLDQVELLKPTHLSLYSLTVEPHTQFYLKGIEEAEEDDVRQQYDYCLKRLRELGFHRYEVSNFAHSKETESKHNKTYWRALPYYGIGPGAHGYDGHIRYSNTRSFNDYFKGHIRKTTTPLTAYDLEFEYVMLNMRLEEGIFYSDYEQRFPRKFRQFFANPMIKLANENLVKIESDRIYVTDDGMMRLHYVILSLTEPLESLREEAKHE